MHLSDAVREILHFQFGSIPHARAVDKDKETTYCCRKIMRQEIATKYVE